KKIKKYTIPQTKSEARGFIGTVRYYRKYIQDFSKIAKPIFKVTSNDEKVEFYWGSEQQKAMDILKEKICEDVVLKHPDFDKEFIVYVDASGGGLGAVLSQEDENGRIRPIAFASKTLVGAENNYSATKNEMQGMHWAVNNQFRQDLLGQKFTGVMDHQALQGIMNTNEGSRRMVKWRVTLQPFVDRMTIRCRQV